GDDQASIQRRDTFQARCQVYVFAHRRVRIAIPAAHVAHHRGPGIDADLDSEALLPARLVLLARTSDSIDYFERRLHGADRMSGIGHRCAPEGERSVAEEALDIPAGLVDRPHDKIEIAVDLAGQRFGSHFG